MRVKEKVLEFNNLKEYTTHKKKFFQYGNYREAGVSLIDDGKVRVKLIIIE